MQRFYTTCFKPFETAPLTGLGIASGSVPQGWCTLDAGADRSSQVTHESAMPNCEGSERQTFGADVEVFASTEERSSRQYPNPPRGAGSKREQKRCLKRPNS